MELNEEQKEIVITNERKVVVLSAPASGKTFLIVERLKYLIAQGVDTSKIVCITFTNAAASELKKRIGDTKDMFIGTVHSYCNRLLMMRGIDTGDIISEENFDELFNRIRQHPEAIREVDHLLLDEAQDSTEEQFFFLLEMVHPTHYMLVGDIRQSIYGFNNAAPGYLASIADDWDVTTFDLNKNYRNGRAILNFARDIIAKNGKQYIDYSIPMTGKEGRVEEIDASFNAIADYIQEDGNYNDWFVLCRANKEIDDMCTVLKRRGIPYDTFKRSKLEEDEFNAVMARDSVKVLTIHTSKGLERSKVAVIGQRYYNPEERCVSYVAATRAKDLLLWTKAKPKRKPAMMNWG